MKALVSAIWPNAPARPMPRIKAACSQRSGTQPGIAARPAPTAMIARNHTTIDCGVSVRVSRLTVTAAMA